MKKLFTLLALVATISQSFAASYRTLLGYSVSGNTYTLWINSDTVSGESVQGEIKYNGSSYTGPVNGSYGVFTRSGQTGNWTVVITLPGGATLSQYQLNNLNQSSNPYGYTTFLNFPGTTLASEMTSFSAKKSTSSTELSWLTASEKDNATFQIERSANATDFSPIGEVKGAGNSNAVKNYTFTDATPLSGVNYYRLKAVDYNGAATLSKIVSVNFTGKNGDKTAVYPNPASDVLRVDYTSDAAATTDIQVTDLTGRVIISQNVSVTKGANLLPLNITSLPSGAYLVKINNDITRFVKM
jgi:hypothetical protein